MRNGCSIRIASSKHGIPKSTIFNKSSGKVPLMRNSGPNTILTTDEEAIIEKWVLSLAVRGFPVTKNQLLRSVQMYLKTTKRKTPFTENLPGRKWYEGFRNRHPIISEKISQDLTTSRAAITEEKIRSWHTEILEYCESHNLLEVLNDPARVFNMDEKGFILSY